MRKKILKRDWKHLDENIGKQSEEIKKFQTKWKTIRRNKKFPNELENSRAKWKLFNPSGKQSEERENFQTDWKTFG
jgi:hypothetical protein